MSDVRRTGGERGLRWASGKRVDGVFPERSQELSVSTPTSGRLQPRTRENGARRWKRGRNVSCRNGPLPTKLGLDYGMP